MTRGTCVDPIKEAEKRRKIGIALKGRTQSEEIRKKISNSLRGKHPSDETLKKLREAHRGEKNGRYGKPVSEETREKIRRANTGHTLTEEQRKKIGESHKGEKHHNFGKHLSEDVRKKISKSLTGKYAGERCYNWQGGISYEPYCVKFNDEFRERVRAFFGYTCQLCGHVWQPDEKKLAVHHVNFRKDACCAEDVTPLFVPLCHQPCHTKTNYNRAFWEDWFTEIINEFYGGECYLPKSPKFNNVTGVKS